jgi:hypothetical protein
MQTNYVGSFQGFQHTVTAAINCSFFVVGQLRWEGISATVSERPGPFAAAGKLRR